MMMGKAVVILRESDVGWAKRQRAHQNSRVRTTVLEERRWARRERLCPPYKSSTSQPSEQQQNQQDHDHKAQSAAAIISGAVERPAADAAEAAKQCNNENDKNNRSNGHQTSPPARWFSLPSLEKQTATHKVPFFRPPMIWSPLFFEPCVITLSG